MAGAVEAFTIKELKGILNVQDSNPTVTTAQSTIVQNNPDRVQSLIINLGAADCWVRFTTGIVAGVGIRIPASGGVLQLVLIEDYMLTAWQIFAVVAAGTTTLFITELVRVSEVKES